MKLSRNDLILNLKNYNIKVRNLTTKSARSPYGNSFAQDDRFNIVIGDCM